MKQFLFGRALSMRIALSLGIMLVSLAQLAGTAPPALAQGTAFIEITNIDSDTGAPVPFTRFQVTSENGTVYGPLETDLDGYVSFSVVVDPWGTNFTIEEETPPACADIPPTQTTGVLSPDDSALLEFTTQDWPGCGLGTIALYAMSCPEGFFGPADDYAPWRDTCLGHNDGTQFTITSVASGQTWYPIAGGYGIPGRAPLVGLPAGDYSFQQDGVAPAAVFCLVYDTENYVTSPNPSKIVPITLRDGIGTIDIDGDRVSCDLFTAPGGGVIEQTPIEEEPVEPLSGASLAIHLSACPAGYVQDASIYDECHGNGVAGHVIQVSSDGGFAAALATNVPESPGPGIASFTGLSEGAYTISTDIPAGNSAFVYCTDNDDQQISVDFDTSNGILQLDLVSGDAVVCDWYEIPIPVEPSGGNSFIEAHAVLCPEGTSTDANLFGLCHGNGLDGVAFSVGGPNGYSDQQLTTVSISPGPGVATFADLPGGTYSIGLALIDPSWSVAMYCSLADADDVVPFTSLDNETISLDVPVDTGVVCDFSVIPPAQPSSTTVLRVINYNCPMGTLVDTGTSLSFLESTCTDTIDGIEVTLSQFGLQGTSLRAGSAGPGMVQFDRVTSGDYAISNSIPGDFNTPWGFCGPEGTELQPLTWLQGGEPLRVDATAGPYLCEWFNNPYNASGYSDTISVTSYLCPPGTTTDYAMRCGAAPLSDTTFQLVRDPGADHYEGVTDAQGTFAFERLLPGKYTMTAFPPPETKTAVYVVSCQTDNGPHDFTYDDSSGMQIRLQLSGQLEVDCSWYNIPAALPTVLPAQYSGSVTVHTFLCQGKSATNYNWEKDCLAQTAPSGFSLKTTSDNPVAVGSTGHDGVVTFRGLADGTYVLDQTTGTWCHAEADKVDTAGNVQVANGGNNDVFIYNCSVRQVGRLPSTGAGVSVTMSASTFDSDKIWQLGLAFAGTLLLAFVARRRIQVAARHMASPGESTLPVEQLDDIR